MQKHRLAWWLVVLALALPASVSAVAAPAGFSLLGAIQECLDTDGKGDAGTLAGGLNADTVDLFDAYGTRGEGPYPHLLALDSQGHFPISVLKDHSVTYSKLGYGSVTTGILRDSAVTTGKLADEAVETGKLAYGAVTAGRLANNSVTTDKITDATIRGDDIHVPLLLGGYRAGYLVGCFNSSSDNGATGICGYSLALTGETRGVVGASNSSSGKGVYGIAKATSGLGYGVCGESASINGRGVFGDATASSGVTQGVYGRASSSSGWGVYGEATHASGDTIGVYGNSASTQGMAVLGRATASSGTTYGVYAKSDSTDGYGVYGYGSYGVYGESDTGPGWGLYGVSNGSYYGTGVYGYATASSGTTYGVRGRTDSDGGYSVYGEATADGFGVYGRTQGGVGVLGNSEATTGITYGVFGRSDSTSGRGVYGWARASSGYTAGIRGDCDSPDGYAGYFNGSSAWYAGYFDGHVDITGDLNVGGSKNFKIDHPLDPANTYLCHSCVESAERMNVYSGNILLDQSGKGWVELPDWFEALNRDFRYNLTPVGAPGPNLYIAQEINGGGFMIAGGSPGMKVSWMVTGTRQDPYAVAHPFEVEVDKPEVERGYYMHPELYGMPETMSIEWARHPEAMMEPYGER